MKNLVSLVLLASIICAQENERFREEMSKLCPQILKIAADSTVALVVDRISDPYAAVEGAGSRSHRYYYTRPKGPCTGTVVTPDGFIATSYFNVSGVLKKITVILPDRTEVEGKLIGYDKNKDIALIKAECDGLKTLKICKTPVEQGDIVFLIGRSPDPKNPTISWGIVSATKRFGESCIQIDCEMNYGNSGGVVVNAKGELLGIANHIFPKSPWGQSGGVGFALKISEFDKMFDKLRKGGKVEKEEGVYIGILTSDSTDPIGAEITEVFSGSPAEDAGLEVGDVIVEMGGQKIEKAADVKQFIASKKAGDLIKVKVKRKTDPKKDKWVEKEFDVKLGASPF